ncbi:MAG TPA: TonB-dependent receptor plug domain-containing protein, partial [Flavobacteriales bacterium]|nr:TonB-dependent receptor plug domain-containing protein [Flavobacteriales bacterium]
MIRTLLFLIAIVSGLYGQGQAYVFKGKVVDKTDGLGLPGASVAVRSSNASVAADGDGNFSLNVLTTDSLLVRFIGYSDQVIAVNGQVDMVISMTPSSTQLNEMVVTALGISREEKSLGFAVGKMDVKTATVIRDPNVVNSMQGKIAGVQITKTSGGPEASSRILIRGNSSVTNNNQPLVVIDGIPMDNTTIGTGGTWGGIDFGSPISDVNPDDIESLIVLKGPSAAALYGSRALNGVIVITTKTAAGTKG